MRGARAVGLLAAAALACAHGRVPEPPPGPGGHVEPELVGLVHVVKPGETLFRIARRYGVPEKELLAVNGLESPRQLQAGMELFVPGAVPSGDAPDLPPGAAAPSGSVPEGADSARKASLRWPVDGVLYSRFGVRQGEQHDGIDIAAPEGTPVGAAADGTVVYAGEQRGYGEIVMLRHPGTALLTVYAHASAILVRPGQAVRAGEPIARVGRTGKTTGPHLHFEVREGTRPRDPLRYLP